PPLDKRLLSGTWKNSSDVQLISGYEFADDGGLKVSIRGMAQPLTGRYSWNGDRSLSLEYQMPDEGQQAYAAAAKEYKEDVRDRIKEGKLLDRAGPSIIGSVRDTWPANEIVQVGGLSEKPRMLIINSEGGVSQTFDPQE